MMNNKLPRLHRIKNRLLSASLAAVMAVSMLPALTPSAHAASWMDPYLEKLVAWGVMRGDLNGNLNPDRAISRAEFVTLINRAFGYNKTGSVPFQDIKSYDWYYDDINIGYNTGYFNGTSATTASPRDTVTREQAAVLLSRNLMLDSQSGETTDFTDSRSIGTWSRGLIASAVSEGILHGYTDGSFKPKQNITRGQMAVMLVNAIGTLVNTSGDHTLGGVYGNVTVSADGVTLRDTTITGNLYITGGLGSGYVNLENVTVLGKIVVCGAGESNKGTNSILLRNVTAPSLIVDSLANQYVTIRADGDTKIDAASIRTPTYLEDATGDSDGFLKVQVDGEDGTKLDAAGNLKDITTLTPKSSVNVNKGSVLSLTVDENAAGSTVSVAAGASVDKLNLDVGTSVTGKGDVQALNVNAAGSSTSMVPDTITVRPGLTANIQGAAMDSVAAAESSADPRLLSGYPTITELNPTSASAVMRTNKAGILYWALTSITDGSAREEDLLSPASVTTILKSGSIKVAASNTDSVAKLSGLTSDGSYYLSAMLVDARGQHSPVKVASFTTPDNATPNFASGYPYMSKITNNAAQVAVMPTKTCRLYYALLPKNSTAPTAKDFRTSAISGNLGMGTVDVTKNVPTVFYVNSKPLTELASYDLYLWLTDVDGAHSSPIKKLTFTTVDKTPPTFLSIPTVTTIKETSVALSATLNETGTIYWVAVKEGTEYPKPSASQATSPALDSDAAKLQVANGMNALKSGKVSAAANKTSAISISGLSSETAYDVYYLAQDKAGNYSAVVGKLTIHTLDTNPPAVTQSFTRTNDTAGKSPLADTDISLTFSESVQDVSTGKQLLDLYANSQDTSLTESERTTAASSLVNILRSDIQLYDASKTPAALVAERNSANATTIGDSWIIDYRGAVVSSDDGKVVVTLKNNTNLNLESGGKYYFQIQNIADTSSNKNIITPNPMKLTQFSTVFAQINLASTDALGTITDGSSVNFDMSFKAVPVSTSSVSSNVVWDILFRTSTTCKFKLYTRTEGETQWTEITGKVASILSNDGTVYGASYSQSFLSSSNSYTSFDALKSMDKTQEFGLYFTELGGNTDRATWNGRVNMEVDVVAASDYSVMRNLAVSNMTDSDLSASVSDGAVKIGYPETYTLKHIFTDSIAPNFQIGYPQMVPSDTTAVMNVQLDRSSGTIYYVVAPVGTIVTTLTDGTQVSKGNWGSLPTTTGSSDSVSTSTPTSLNIMSPKYSSSAVKTGHVSYTGSVASISLSDLIPSQQYCAYFVLQGDSQNVYSDHPYIFQFQTSEVTRPIVTLDINNPSVTITVNSTSTLDYLLAVNGNEPGQLRKSMSSYVDTSDASAVALFTTGTYADYTVLDAMSQDYYEGSTLAGSVFDVYATQAAKTSFANYIRSQVPSSGSVVLKSAVTVPSTSPVTVNCGSAMSGDTWYTFLTVGKSSSGSGDAFRAIRPVFNLDESAPVITSCNFTLSNSQPITSSNGVCNGTLLIQFNEDLYWRNQSSVDQTTTPLEGQVGPSSSTGFYAAGLVFQRSSSISLKPSSSASTISSVTFTLSSARPGDNITAPINLSDKSGNVHSVPLSIVLKYTNNGDGTFTPFFTINSDWNATS